MPGAAPAVFAAAEAAAEVRPTGDDRMQSYDAADAARVAEQDTHTGMKLGQL